jgi:hypothetical protein
MYLYIIMPTVKSKTKTKPQNKHNQKVIRTDQVLITKGKYEGHPATLGTKYNGIKNLFYDKPRYNITINNDAKRIMLKRDSFKRIKE